MKDEFHNPSLETASQKSVTDWLMQVISGKKPIELNINHAAQEEKQPEAKPPAPRLVAVAATPRVAARTEDVVSPNGVVEEQSVFTAEDLCGPPLLPIIPVIREVKPPKEEITAEDLCWVPKGQELKPQPIAAVDAAPVVEPPVAEPPAAEPQEHEITAADITRDTASDIAEPENDAIDAILRRLEQAQQTVTAADLLREPGSYAAELAAAAAAAEEEPKTQLSLTAGAGSVADEAVASAPAESAVAPEPMTEPETSVVAAEPTPETHPEVHAEASAAAVEETVHEPAWQEAAALGEGSAPQGVEGETEQIAATHIPDEQDGMHAEAPMDPAATEAAAMADASLLTEQHTDVLAELAANASTTEGLIQGPGEQVESQAGVAGESVFAKEDVWARSGVWREPTPAEAAAREDVFQDPSFREQTKHYPEERMYPQADELKDLEMETQPEGWNAAWKTLLRLGSMLPWLARALPMLEAGARGEQSPGLVQEVRHEVAGMRMVQYEIKTTVQDHSLQLKRMEEQLTRLRESLDSPDNNELTKSVKLTAKLVQMAGIGLGALLLVLLIMVAVLLAHHH
ncbi:MAG: hypothetical protein WA634_10395 [Silvibacterium sp.]